MVSFLIRITQLKPTTFSLSIKKVDKSQEITSFPCTILDSEVRFKPQSNYYLSLLTAAKFRDPSEK